MTYFWGCVPELAYKNQEKLWKPSVRADDLQVRSANFRGMTLCEECTANL